MKQARSNELDAQSDAAMSISYEQGLEEIDSFYDSPPGIKDDSTGEPVAKDLTAKQLLGSSQAQQWLHGSITHCEPGRLTRGIQHNKEEEFAALVDDIDQVTAYDVGASYERHYTLNEEVHTASTTGLAAIESGDVGPADLEGDSIRQSSKHGKGEDNPAELRQSQVVDNREDHPVQQSQYYLAINTGPLQAQDHSQVEQSTTPIPSVSVRTFTPSPVQDVRMTQKQSPELPSSSAKSSLFSEMRTEELESLLTPQGHVKSFSLRTRMGGGSIGVNLEDDKDHGMVEDDSGSDADAPSSPIHVRTFLRDAETAQQNSGQYSNNVGLQRNSEPLKSGPLGAKALNRFPGPDGGAPESEQLISNVQSSKGSMPANEGYAEHTEDQAQPSETRSMTLARKPTNLEQQNQVLKSQSKLTTQNQEEMDSQPKASGKREESPKSQGLDPKNEELVPQKAARKRRSSTQRNEDTAAKKKKAGLGQNELKGLLQNHFTPHVSPGGGKTRAQKEEEAKKQPNGGAAAKARHGAK